MAFISKLIFGKYLLVTNTVSCGLMMAVGDAMQQRSDFLKKHIASTKSTNEFLDDQETIIHQDDFTNDTTLLRIVDEPFDDNDNYNYVRTRNMTTVGLLQGPFHHYFYAVLEKYLPGRSTVSIFKKTVVDQAIASPTCLGIFFFGLGALEKKNFDDINGEVKLKLFDTWKVDCMFWPPTQFFNFLLVPMRYRVIYINFMTMFYDMFLSYMKYDVQ